jgi:tRNA threonylcarbamoyladenosine biosynthesis protein TsaB
MELAIDTAGSVLGVALTEAGALVADLSWHSRSGAAAELLPAVDVLLTHAGARRTDLRAIFVCRGPGSYGGLRVGISTAMGLAFALDAGLLAVGRLEADAFVHAAYPGTIVPVHAAGRGELAWAVYRSTEGWHEVSPPHLSHPEELLADAPRDALVCGEVSGDLEQQLHAARADVTIRTGSAHHRRAVTVAALAWTRYEAGARDSHLALEPIYLREPNITGSRRTDLTTNRPHDSRQGG